MWDWLLNLQKVRLGEGDLTVRLTQFWSPWLAALATAAAVALVVWVYRRDGGTKVGRAVGGVLRSLLLLLLLLLIWQPVIRLERNRRESGVVAVMVDTSASMATADNYGPDDPLVKALLAAASRGAPASQPADQSAEEIVRRLDRDSRLELVRQALTRDDGKVIDVLRENNDVAIYSFSQGAARQAQFPQKSRKTEKDHGEQPNNAQGSPSLGLDKLLAKEPATSLGQAIAQALNELRGQRLAGLIVLSDGRSTLESDPAAVVELATRKFRAPVPIHAVTVGSIHPPRDLAVSRVVAEPVVFVKDLVAVEATIRQHGYDQPERIVVRLFDQERQAQLAQETVTVGEADGSGSPKREVKTELRFQPHSPGTYRLAVRVEPAAGDLNPANNVGTAQVEVKDAKIRVLYVEGYPRWEYRFLIHSLTREQTVRVSAMLMNADPEFAQEGTEPITRLPLTPEEWRRYDVIFYGDVNPFDLTLAQMEQIEQLVRERGAGFAMIAGEQFSPQRYLNTPLVRLLPVDLDPSAGPDRIDRTAGWRAQLTPDGRRSPILRFERDPRQNEDTFKVFPELFWFKPVLSLRPGADVLAEHPTALLPNGQPAPLLVAGRYGAGKTFFSAIDETWRWRRHTGVAFFDGYWLQLARWLSRSKLLGADRRFELSTDQSEYDLGARIDVQLRVLDKTLTNLPETIPVIVTDQNGRPVETLALRKAAAKGDVYDAEYVPPGEGEFAFALDRAAVQTRFGLTGQDNVVMPRSQVHVALASRENQQLAIDAESMATLAALTNGRSGTLADLDALAAGVPDLSRPIEDDIILPLWDTRLALILFALIITAEWILRKKYNLQ